ncbi:hypothetical protein DMC64_41785 [Amycolatopsis sp. WAC 04197]|nr:hypothetical protein DMC64_41785 [Amycolatopsis sp. WAC 04197]
MGLMTILEDSPVMRPALGTLGLPRLDEVTDDDLWTALKVIPEERLALNATERLVIETLRDRDVSWTEIGTAYEISRQAAKKRYEQTLGGTRTWSPKAVDQVARDGARIRVLLAVEGAAEMTMADSLRVENRRHVLIEVITSVLADKLLTEDEVLELGERLPGTITEAIMDKAVADAARGRGRDLSDEIPRDLDAVDPDVLLVAMSTWLGEMARHAGDRVHWPVRAWNKLEPGDRHRWIEGAQARLDQAEKKRRDAERVTGT